MVLGGTFLLLPMFSSIQTQLFSMEGPCQAQPVFPSHVASCTQVLVVARVILLQFIAKICATACETFLLSHSPGGVSEAKLGVWGELWLCTAGAKGHSQLRRAGMLMGENGITLGRRRGALHPGRSTQVPARCGRQGFSALRSFSSKS